MFSCSATQRPFKQYYIFRIKKKVFKCSFSAKWLNKIPVHHHKVNLPLLVYMQRNIRCSHQNKTAEHILYHLSIKIYKIQIFKEFFLQNIKFVFKSYSILFKAMHYPDQRKKNSFLIFIIFCLLSWSHNIFLLWMKLFD